MKELLKLVSEISSKFRNCICKMGEYNKKIRFPKALKKVPTKKNFAR